MRRPKSAVVVQVLGWGREEDPTCSFCKRKRSIGNRRMVAGPDGVYICEECVELCVETLEEERR